jgi:hypothetical protein
MKNAERKRNPERTRRADIVQIAHPAKGGRDAAPLLGREAQASAGIRASAIAGWSCAF